MAEKRTPEEEIKYLRKLLKVRVDLANGKVVNLLSADDSITLQDAADIKVLTSFPEWQSFERWYLLNAKMLYEQAASAGRDEAYVMVRLAKCLVDMLDSARRLTGQEEKKEKGDAFDQDEQPARHLPGTPGNDLPMGDDDI